MSDRDTTSTTTATAESTHHGRADAPAYSAGTTVVHGMLASGHHDHRQIASVLEAYPSSKTEILALLHQTVGNTFVHSVLELVSPTVAVAIDAASSTNSTGATSGPLKVTAHGLHVRKTPETRSDDNIVGMLHKDATVDGTGHHDERVKSEHRGKPAFACGKYLERHKDGA